MHPHIKYLIIAAILFPALLSYSLSGWAQPFGMPTQQTREEGPFRNLATDKGRFVFGQISDSGKDKFMLDTWTGRLWRLAESGGIGIYLAPVPYKISEGKYNPVPGKISDEDHQTP